MDNRGQTNVLGVVLLLGITMIGVTSVVVIGSDALTATEQQVRIGNAQHQFQRVDSIISRVAYGGGDTATLDLSSLQLGGDSELRYEQTGYLTVSTEGTVLLNRSLGILIYKSGDQQIAYQAGGVWAGTGNQTQLISRPEFQYRETTLTLPMISLKGTDVYQSESLTVRQTGPTNRVSNSVVEDSLVTITIQSRYYQAWGAYFDQQFTDVRLQYDHSNDSVTIELGDIQQGTVQLNNVIFAADDQVTIEGGSINGNVTSTGYIDGEDHINGTATELSDQVVSPIDSQISDMVNVSDTAAYDTSIPGESTTTLTSGTYFVDEQLKLEEGGELVLDVSSGNVTLVVDADIKLEGGGTIRVANPSGGTAQIYLTGDFKAEGSSMATVPDDDATSLMIYATSDSTFKLESEKATPARFIGTFYAPRNPPASPTPETNICDAVSICVEGNTEIHGALVGGDVKVEGKDGKTPTISYDPALGDVQLPFYNPPQFNRPDLAHLHVSTRNVTIRG